MKNTSKFKIKIDFDSYLPLSEYQGDDPVTDLDIEEGFSGSIFLIFDEGFFQCHPSKLYTLSSEHSEVWFINDGYLEFLMAFILNVNAVIKSKDAQYMLGTSSWYGIIFRKVSREKVEIMMGFPGDIRKDFPENFEFINNDSKIIFLSEIAQEIKGISNRFIEEVVKKYHVSVDTQKCLFNLRKEVIELEHLCKEYLSGKIHE